MLIQRVDSLEHGLVDFDLPRRLFGLYLLLRLRIRLERGDGDRY